MLRKQGYSGFALGSDVLLPTCYFKLAKRSYHDCWTFCINIYPITRYWVDLLLATVVHRPVSGLQKIYIQNNGYPFEIQCVSLIAKIACAYEYVWRGRESVVHPKNFAGCFDFNWESVLSICFRITSLSLGYLPVAPVPPKNVSTQHWFR